MGCTNLLLLLLLLLIINIMQIRLYLAPQDLQICGRCLANGRQSDTQFAGSSLLRMVIIDRLINNLLGRLTVDAAGKHSLSRNNAFVYNLRLALYH